MAVTAAVQVTICSRPHCDKPVERYELCNGHYRKACRAGKFNIRVDMDKAVERIANLRANRWTFKQIGTVAGIHHTIIADVFHRRQKRCTKGTYNAIMSVPVLPGVAVTAVGFKRRVQALAWMGWPQRVVAEEMGTSEKAIRAVLYTGKFSVDYGQRLADVYKRLSDIEGPSELAKSRARGIRAYAPPAAWDDDTIDTAPDLPRGIMLNDRPPRAYNTKRGKDRSYCRSGHALTADNILTYGGVVRCKTCHDESNRRYREKLKA
jgi:hypothetical protein